MNEFLNVTAAERRRVSDVDRLLREKATQALVERLSDPSWVVRRAVVSALARVGEGGIAALCDVLRRQRDDEARLAATMDALVASLSSAGQVERAVVRLLDSEDPAVICDAVQVLGRRRHVPAMPRLAALAQHANENVALAAIEAIGRIGGGGVVDALVAAIGTRSFFRAFPAIDALGRTGDPRAVCPLSALLGESHYSIEAARALGRTGQPKAAPALAAMLVRPSDAQVRVAAVALAEIHDRYTERFGPNRAVADALRMVDANAASRRLKQALTGCDAAERAAMCRVLGWAGGTNAVHSLLELLDAEPEVARAAAGALSTLEAPAEPFLLRALRDSGSERRLLLLPVLGQRASSTPYVLACLGDANPSVRALACDSLGKLGDTSAVVSLFARLRDGDARVSQAAVAAIQALGSDQTERLALEASASADPRERRSALRILSYFGWPAALDVFLAAMEDPDERIRDLAASGLAAIEDDRSMAALIAAAGHPSARTRAAAIRGLGNTRRDGAVRARLRDALRDPDAWVRYYACQALGRLGDESSAEAIRTLIDDPAGHVRVAVIDALARLGGEESLEALHEAAQSSDPDVQRAALLGLGSVKSASSLPHLQNALASEDAATRLVAVSALAELDGPEASAALGRAMDDSDDSVRSAAIGLLATRPGLLPTALLVGRLGQEGARDRVLAALAQPVEGRVPALLTALHSADAARAPLLVSALARMGGAEAAVAIEDALSADNVVARRAAVAAVAAQGTASSRKLLERVAAGDPDAEVRAVCGAFLRG